MKNTKEKYNVYIVRNKNKKAILLIGKNMSELDTCKKENLALNFIDSENYSIFGIITNSKVDKKYQKDITNNK